MGAFFRKPIDTSSIDDLIEEGNRLHALYIYADSMNRQNTVYSQWINIRACVLYQLQKKPCKKTQKWVDDVHQSILHKSKYLYTIPEKSLEEPLLD